jgi:hypothetical protein
MRIFRRPILKCCKGISIIEILIATFITGVLATAALSFFSGMHNQSVTQRNVAEMKDLARSTLMELKKTVRMAGYKLPEGHPPYEIFGTTIGVYSSQTKAVDTTWLYLQEFAEFEYDQLYNLPDDRQLFKLMKMVNSDPPDIFSDFIVNLQYTTIDSNNVLISVTTQTPKYDMDWPLNNGYRTYTTEERVKIRNAG